jgi:type VI secretion system protein ImpF
MWLGDFVKIKKSVFDRLSSDSYGFMEGVQPTLTVNQLRDLVARDLECLLNSRGRVKYVDQRAYPHASGSVLNFGVRDFSGCLLSSHRDRMAISEDIRQAIQAYEPRLRQVFVDFSIEKVSIGALAFTIRALLVIKEEREMVNFDAVLHPAAAKYQIKNARAVAG